MMTDTENQRDMAPNKGTQLFAISTKLNTTEFNTLSSLVYEQCGIKLPVGKKILLESRLHKRLKTLHMTSFKEYIGYLTSSEGMSNELIHMIDEVTTNKTDFFREPHHFDFLKEHILPEFSKNGARRTFKVWSSACSSGEEPYTIAMVLHDYAKTNIGFDYSILASDISSEILQKAVKAVYSMDRVAAIPLSIKQKFFLRSIEQIKPTVRIVPELRNKVNFKRLNLMDKSIEVEDGLDIIFCRNVLIYFDRQTQEEVVRKLTEKLKPGGYLIIGHSESLFQLNLPIVQVKPTIFRKK
jgi:chemotaxis protein methyltransferase CheR